MITNYRELHLNQHARVSCLVIDQYTPVSLLLFFRFCRKRHCRNSSLEHIIFAYGLVYDFPRTMSPKMSTADEREFSRVYAQIERAILIGELKPRERLVESDLAKRWLHVSRTPVREALHRLEANGLVYISPHRGAVVSDLSVGDVESIYAIRLCLEIFATRLSLALITPNEIEELSRLEATCRKLASSGDLLELLPADDRFHDAIYSAAKNPYLLNIIRQLRQRLSFTRFTAWSLSNRVQRCAAEHGQMVELLRMKDWARLAWLTRRHLRNARDVLLRSLSPIPELLVEGKGAKVPSCSKGGKGPNGVRASQDHRPRRSYSAPGPRS